MLNARKLAASLLFSCVISASSVVGQSLSQQSKAGDQITFKQTVNRVVIDVVVTDAEGKPARGLSSRNFTVFEDGKKQAILFFDVHDLRAGATFTSKPLNLPPNTFANIPTAPERGPLYVLLLDLYHTQVDDQPYARQQLLKFVSSKPEGTRFAVFVVADGLHLIQGFTQDRNQLYSILDPSHPALHVPRILLNRFSDVDTLQVLNTIAFYVDGLPGRKNLVWFSGSFPVGLFATANPDPDYQAETIETLRTLTRSQTAVYPVDIRGVIPGSDPMHTHGLVMLLAGEYQAEDEIARLTGGHAFYSRNDLSDVLSEVTDLGANYYSLTYSPSNQDYDGKLRQVRVDLSKKNYHLEYRRSYYANGPESLTPSETDQAAQPPSEGPGADSLYANMRHGAPTSREVLFQVHLYPLGPPTFATSEQLANLANQPAYFRKRKKTRPEKLDSIQLQTYFLDYSIFGRVPILEIATAAYDREGALLNADIEHTVSPDTSSTAAMSGGKFYRIQQRFDVPVATAYMRVAIRDVSTDHIGALEISLPLTAEPTGSTP